MNCEAVVKSIPLYFYGELAPETEERLEDHLHSCAECRSEMDSQRSLAAALERSRVRPPATLLAECRHDLMRAVYREETPEARVAHSESDPWRLFREAFSALLHPGIRIRHINFAQPAAAMILVALGYFSARFTTASANVAGASLSPDSIISAVRSVQPDTSGRVRIAVDETRRRTISGRLDDSNIQRLLLAGAREDSDPGVRVESVDILKTRSGSAEVRSALLEALTADPNPGVRLKALDGLRGLTGDPEVRKTLAQVLLKDTNPGVRIQVIDLLIAHKDSSTVGVLQNLVRREDNNYVRMRCRNALQEMNASVGTF